MSDNAPFIVLASGSKIRAKLLKNAGISFATIPASIDEYTLITHLKDAKKTTHIIPVELAKAKALKIAERFPDSLVIGADQIIVFENNIVTKAKDDNEALIQLRKMSGQTHTLISGVAIAKGEKILWSFHDKVEAAMHDLDENFWLNYKEKARSTLTQTVGGYEFEGLGSWLFKEIKGDFFTALGLPLLPLLGYLHQKQGIYP